MRYKFREAIGLDVMFSLVASLNFLYASKGSLLTMSVNPAEYDAEYAIDDAYETLPFSELELRVAMMSAPSYLYGTIDLPEPLPFPLEANTLVRPLLNISSINEEISADGSYSMKCDVTDINTGEGLEDLDGHLHTRNVADIIPRAVAHSINAHTSEIPGHSWIYENPYWALYQSELNRIQFAYPLAGTQTDLDIPTLEDLNAGYES